MPKLVFATGLALWLLLMILFPVWASGELEPFHPPAALLSLIGAVAFASWDRLWLVARIVALNLLFLPSVLEFVYSVRFGAGLDSAAIHATMQSNLNESLVFVFEFFSFGYLALLATCLLSINGFLWFCKKEFGNGFMGHPILSLLLVLAWFTPTIGEAREGYFAYQTELENWNRELGKRKIATLSTYTEHDDETYLVIIGESSTRRHWSLYGYQRNTTPAVMALDDLYVFRDLISTHSHTVPALTKALTSSHVTDSNEHSSPSIIDLAKSAGFSTYWLSNQQRMGVWDNAVSILAEIAGNKTFINLGFGASRKSKHLDQSLLPHVAEAFADKRTAKKLIVVHLMGSHFPYDTRYPSGFEKHHGTSQVIDAYDNSIAYTDYLLGELFRMAEEAGVCAVVYFSDHGEDPAAGLGHNSTKMTKAMVEIPFIVRLSGQFMNRYPEAVELLAHGQNKPLTGDYIFNLISWLMRIQGADYQNPLLPEFRSGPRYTRNGELLYTNLK